MTDRARKLLDNLLGHNRDNLIENDNTNNCIFQMAGGCPFEMLKNTKLSLGSCKYKNHENIKTVNKIFYEQELFTILTDLFDNINKKIKENVSIKDNEIQEIEDELDFKLMEIEQNVTEENVKEIYKKFLEIEKEILELEKKKERYFLKFQMEKCEICGLNIIRNFCSKKFINHLEGRAHTNILKLRDLYENLKNVVQLK